MKPERFLFMPDHATVKLDEVITLLKARYGNNVIQPARTLVKERPLLATGIPELDQLLKGGFLISCINEVIGQPTSGATSIVYRSIASAQVQKYEIVYIDLCQLFDAVFASYYGVNTDKVLLVYPPNVGDALELIRDIALCHIPCLIVLDNGDTPSVPHVSRQHLHLSHSVAIVLALGSKSLQSAQVQLVVKRRSWICTEFDIIGYQVSVTLNKHLHLPTANAEFPLMAHWEVDRD